MTPKASVAIDGRKCNCGEHSGENGRHCARDGGEGNAVGRTMWGTKKSGKMEWGMEKKRESSSQRTQIGPAEGKS